MLGTYDFNKCSVANPHYVFCRIWIQNVPCKKKMVATNSWGLFIFNQPTPVTSGRKDKTEQVLYSQTEKLKSGTQISKTWLYPLHGHISSHQTGKTLYSLADIFLKLSQNYDDPSCMLEYVTM
jgi:hypothetical protein